MSDAAVACGLDEALADFVQKTRKRGILTIGRARGDVEKFTAVAVLVEGEQVKIVVNMQHAKAERIQLSPSLLRVAEVL